MKNNNRILAIACLVLTCWVTQSFYSRHNTQNNNVTGGWKLENNNNEQVLLFADGYFSHTSYNKKDKKFDFTSGGTFAVQNNQLQTKIEFDTRQKETIGQTVNYQFSMENGKLTLDINGKKDTWSQLDKGGENLAGTWRITARKQDDKIVPIHQTGPRKTVKILTGTRFQWAAINPETKEFFGTGGGSYTFNNGKYTENIEFFSRDSSRVGAALTFDGKLTNGEWHHSGLSSRGDAIYEVWGRVNK
jgi:hypothetical protein